MCHSPAWVKDIQMNRQLSSIIEVFSHLESLLKPGEQPGKQELFSHVEAKEHSSKVPSFISFGHIPCLSSWPKSNKVGLSV